MASSLLVPAVLLCSDSHNRSGRLSASAHDGAVAAKTDQQQHPHQADAGADAVALDMPHDDLLLPILGLCAPESTAEGGLVLY
jgi:hypothetical protein